MKSIIEQFKERGIEIISTSCECSKTDDDWFRMYLLPDLTLKFIIPKHPHRSGGNYYSK